MSGPGLHVVLVFPEIPWNAGNAGRTCLAAGAQLHLVEPLGFSLEDRYLRRAGLDYWPRVQPVVWPSWDALEAELPGLGEPFFFTAGAGRSYWQARYPERSVLVFGREGSGLPADLLERYRDRSVAIPMVGSAVRSLNLSSSVALGVYEARRQAASGGLSRVQPPSGAGVQSPKP